MKKPLKITLIVLAVLLVLVIAAYFILTGLCGFQWVDGWGFYAHDPDSSTLTLVPFPEIWNCRTLSNINSVEQIGDHVYCAIDRDYSLYPSGIQEGTAVVFGSGEMWEFDSYNGTPEQHHGSSPLYEGRITKAILLDGVTNLSSYFFRMCMKLETLYLPASIQEFDCNALTGCEGITSIHFAGNFPEIVIMGKSAPTNCYPLDAAYPSGTVTVYYQPGTTGWDPAFWEDYAVLVEREYEVDWS